MGRIRIMIRGDGLAAEIKISPGPPMKAPELQAALAEAKLVHGIDTEAVAKLGERIVDPVFQGNAPIATGQAPVNGVDGRLDGEFLHAKIAGTEHTDGHIDYHERELLHPALADQVVARIVAPTPGTPGRDVRGKVLPPKPGRPHPQRFGSGVKIDGDRVISLRQGAVFCTDRQFDVVPLHVHKGDVHLASGNLHTPGSVQVQGDVREGFAVTADGDVMIGGAVLDAKVTAGGTAVIHHGILGAGCEVRAGEDIECRHATSALLVAGNTLEIGDQATHCRMMATHIRLTHGRGAAFGGELRAKSTIELRTAGTQTGAATLLSVADLVDELAELARLEAEAARHDRVALKGARGEDVRMGGQKGLRQGTKASDRAQQERLRVLARQRELLRDAAISVRDTIWPGVVLQFGSVRLPVGLPIQHAQFRFDLETNTIVQGRLP